MIIDITRQRDSLLAARAAIEVALEENAALLRQYIQEHPKACPLCQGSGEIEADRKVDCCSGHEHGVPVCGCGGMGVWEAYSAPCPYGCEALPSQAEIEAMERERAASFDNFPF